MSRKRHMAKAWQTHGKRMANTWRTHGEHMANTMANHHGKTPCSMPMRLLGSL